MILKFLGLAVLGNSNTRQIKIYFLIILNWLEWVDSDLLPVEPNGLATAAGLLNIVLFPPRRFCCPNREVGCGAPNAVPKPAGLLALNPPVPPNSEVEVCCGEPKAFVVFAEVKAPKIKEENILEWDFNEFRIIQMSSYLRRKLGPWYQKYLSHQTWSFSRSVTRLNLSFRRTSTSRRMIMGMSEVSVGW